MQARVGKPGSVDSAAQTCALNEIEDLNCAGAHSTITEPSQDGAQAVADLLPPGADLGWLGQRSTFRFGVGWAYDPKSQQYLCAFVKNGLPPPTSPTLDSRS